MTSLLLATSPFSVSQFVKAFEDEFVEVVYAKQSLLKLKHKGVISPDVKTSIEDAKYVLFEHLEKYATVNTLREYRTDRLLSVCAYSSGRIEICA